MPSVCIASRAPNRQALFTARLIIMGLMALDAFLIIFIAMYGGGVIHARRCRGFGSGRSEPAVVSLAPRDLRGF